LGRVLLQENDVGEVGSTWAIIVIIPFIMLFLLITLLFAVPFRFGEQASPIFEGVSEI
jgi:hypothetical protein